MPSAKPRRNRAQWLLHKQIELPLYALLAVLVMHALSGPSSPLAHSLPAGLHAQLSSFLPRWARLPSLASFASDVPNASRRGLLAGHYLTGSNHDEPWRAEAAGFGHPLTALHAFTRACLGLSYPVNRSPLGSIADAQTWTHSQWDDHSASPWSWLAPRAALYAKGRADALYVVTWILLFTALRALAIKHILIPFGSRCVAALPPDGWDSQTHGGAGQAAKARSKAARSRDKTVLRFAEQGWALLYYVVYWSLGMYIASKMPYWPLNVEEYWTDYPQDRLDALTKFYYLTQCAFWFQQVFVLHIEARRGDHVQMLSHHIITICLITGSYVANLHRVGNAILCLMDLSDIFLPFAKMLRYVGLRTLCDAAFAGFMVSWFITRHILYNIVLWSCTFDCPRLIPYASADFSRGRYLNKPTHSAFVTLLVALQVILCIWFGMIVKVAWRVISGDGAVDSRSDEETTEDEYELDDAEEEKKRLKSAAAISGRPSSEKSLRKQSRTSSSSASEPQSVRRRNKA